MTLDEIREVVGLCQYKPGWSFAVVDDKSRLYLQINCESSVCAVDGTPTTWRSAKHYLSEFMCKQELVGVCFKAVQQAEEHELREFFRYRGARIFNPHIDPDALVTVAGIENTRTNPMLMTERVND